METTPAEAKHDLLCRLLDLGMVQIMLDARTQGVDVPTHLRTDYQLRLNLSYRFNNHMEIDYDGIEATLTFKGEPYTCRIPWSSLYMMVLTSNEDPPYIFPGDMPPELIHLANQLQDELKIEKPAAEPPELSLVRGEGSEPPKSGNDKPDGNDQDKPPPTGRGRSHLRVIK